MKNTVADLAVDHIGHYRLHNSILKFWFSSSQFSSGIKDNKNDHFPLVSFSHIQVHQLTEEGELTQAQEVSRRIRNLLYSGLFLGLLGWGLLITIVLIYCLTTEDESAVEALSHDGKYNIFVPN